MERSLCIQSPTNYPNDPTQNNRIHIHKPSLHTAAQSKSVAFFTGKVQCGKYWSPGNGNDSGPKISNFNIWKSSPCTEGSFQIHSRTCKTEEISPSTSQVITFLLIYHYIGCIKICFLFLYIPQQRRPNMEQWKWLRLTTYGNF